MTTNDTNEQLQQVGTLTYINLFTTHADTNIQRVGYIISGQYMILNVFLSRGRKLADEMGRGKKNPIILTHRKRVTSELHDSYFRSMTIEAIVWALSYYSTQVSLGPRAVAGRDPDRPDVVGKATPDRGGTRKTPEAVASRLPDS